MIVSLALAQASRGLADPHGSTLSKYVRLGGLHHDDHHKLQGKQSNTTDNDTFPRTPALGPLTGKKSGVNQVAIEHNTGDRHENVLKKSESLPC